MCDRTNEENDECVKGQRHNRTKKMGEMTHGAHILLI